MQSLPPVEKKRSFIISFLYLAIWVLLIYATLKYAMPMLMPFVVAFIIAFILKSPINKISEKTKLNRKPVAVVVLTLVYTAIVSLIIFSGAQLAVFLVKWFSNLPTYYTRYIEPALGQASILIDNFVARLDPALVDFFKSSGTDIIKSLSGIITSISSGALNFLGNMATSVPWLIVSMLLSVIASYFIVVDYYKIVSFIMRQFPERARRKIFVIKDYFVGTLFRFGRAYFIIICITFAEISLGLLILRVPNPFPIAFITAIVDILPILGTGTIMLPWAVFALIQGNMYLGIGLIILYAVILFVRQIIEPRIVGTQIGLYPLLTLIAMFVGAKLFGVWGLFGFPIALTVLIHLDRTKEIKLFK